MKVVVCGPPHSGKSVFISGLVGQLDRRDYYLFRACPDGEGSWTYAEPDNARLRRKGGFTSEFVQWCVSSLHENNLAPITVVDVGGRISSENRQIMAECDFAIILSGDPAQIPVWREFATQECGLRVIAELHSDYHASADVVEQEVPVVCGSVHHLERGEVVTSRPAIEAVGRLIYSILGDDAHTSGRESREGDFIMTSTTTTPSSLIEIAELAEALGKSAVKKVLPNGRTIETIEWEGSDLPLISRILHNQSADFGGKEVRINGGAPGWLHAAVAHECHPGEASLNSPDGYVPIGTGHAPAGLGVGPNLEFTCEAREGFVLVTCQQIDPSVPLAPAALAEITPPIVEFGAVVVLNGRMPNWLLASLAMSYHGLAKAVACNQPGKGATVCWTHSTSVELGSTIAVEL
jgi:CRISPR-associated Csx3 family protein